MARAPTQSQPLRRRPAGYSLASGSVLPVVWLLAACGGSAADPAAPGVPVATATSPAVSAAPSPAESSASPPTATPVAAPAPATPASPGDAGCSHPAAEAQAIELINRLRAAGATCGSQVLAPTSPLNLDARLTGAAASHSADMVQRNHFSHTGSSGSTVGQRVTAAGYAWASVAENIAAGYPTVSAAIQSWIASPGHCANLMSANLRDAGLACVPGTASNDYRSYWTLNLARPR
jgi:uncharacterized protein YkwD